MHPPLRTGLLLVLALIPVDIAAQTLPAKVDEQRSSITVHVFKAGLFSTFGHDHEIRGPVSGAVDEKERRVELVVHARQLVVLDTDLPPDKRAEVQQRMLGPDVLDSERFPEIRFRSTSVEADGPGRWLVRGDCTVHGQTRPIKAQVTAENGRYAGTFSIKQRDFGIKPVSAGGGTVKVKDEIKVDFQMVTQP